MVVSLQQEALQAHCDRMAQALRGGGSGSRRPNTLPEGFTWRPQPRQADCIKACGLLPIFDNKPAERPVANLIGYGGAAGGGKTDTDLAIAMLADAAFPGCTIGFFRRTFSELQGADGAIERSRIMFAGTTAKYTGDNHMWRLPNGSKLHFCHCQHVPDRLQYQGWQFDILIPDEATHFPWVIIDYLLTRNRASEATDKTEFVPFALFSTNPGNVGHQWYRELFIDSGSANEPHEAQNPNGKLERVVFFPARLEDNAILMNRADGDYERKLMNRDEETVRALRWGDWDIAAGLFFAKHWRAVPRDGRPAHIIPNREVPADWVLYGSVDYGFHNRSPEEKPFVYGLYGVGQLEPGGVTHTVRIDEIAAAHWDVSKQKEEIAKLEARYPQKVRRRVGCRGMWTKRKEFGPTIAEEYASYEEAGVSLPVEFPNDDHLSGLEQCRLYLNDADDGLPHFMSFERCTHFNRQIASVPCDERHPDDIDPNAEEHAIEEWRHFLMSRPRPAQAVKPRVNVFSAEWAEQQMKRQTLANMR